MKKSLKSLSIVSIIMVFVLSLMVNSFAVDMSKNGTYSVPVTLYKSDSDKESMGNKYIVQTALITVENGKKYITVIANDVDDLTFSYYLDGSVEGEKKEAETVENVEIDGTVYPIGYKFPLVTDADAVGVAFKAPIMPVSPSARLKIDYSSAKLLKSDEKTTAKETTAKETTTAAADDGTTAAGTEETTAATETETTALADETNTEATVAEESTSEETTVTEAAEAGEESSSSSAYIIVAVVAAAAVIIAVVCIVRKKKK